MPLAEEFPTVFVVAGEDTCQAPCNWICELDLGEVFSRRYVDFFLKDCEINGLSRHFNHLGVLRESESVLNSLHVGCSGILKEFEVLTAGETSSVREIGGLIHDGVVGVVHIE